jgi:prepilin-type N-terminal cleavage/methylation domain-containing protein
MVAGMRCTTASRQYDDGAVGGSRRVGFTLIELLVAVAVITLLLTISIPAMSAARRISKRTVCGTNLHSIGQALQAYLSVHNDTYPYIRSWPPDEDAEGVPIYEALGKEVSGSRDVFRCPADAKVMNDPDCTKPTYFETVGTSYWWEFFYNGKRVGRDIFTSKRGIGMGAAAAWIVHDYKPFHGGPERKGSMMVLYTDFHVQPDNWVDSASTRP